MVMKYECMRNKRERDRKGEREGDEIEWEREIRGTVLQQCLLCKALKIRINFISMKIR